VGCRLCAKSCPEEAIAGDLKKVHVIDQSQCIRCGMCFEACPPKIRAVERLSGQEVLATA
jgi:Fe-S-cluster-containing hydrogenase component 2